MKKKRNGPIDWPIQRLIYIFIAFIIFWSCFTVVGAGHRGVVFSKFSGVQEGIFDEGFNLKVPVVQKVIKMEVRTQKIETTADSASQDLQDIQTTIALNFHLDSSRVNKLYQQIGKQYRGRIIDPAIQEGVKAITAKYTAEELITRRAEVRQDMKDFLTERLGKSFIVVDDFNIVNFQFSEEFDKAIEQKVTAEQLALKAERDLDRIKIEKEQKITRAQAEAESIRIQTEALKQGQDILELRAIEKWNGKMPLVTGGATPFVDLSKVIEGEVNPSLS